MKKIIIISGIIAVFFLAFLLTGAADKDDAIKKALWYGNRQYEAAEYKEALELYETGLAESPENKALNFNAAQAAYLLGEYEKAVEYYEKSEDCTEKFLNAGNVFFRAGEMIEDENQKGQYYMQALQMYHEGITKFPQDVPLKYNYEVTKAKVEEYVEENSEQESSESDSSEESEESSESGEASESDENQETQEEENEEASESESEKRQESQEQESEESQSEGEEENSEEQESYSQEDGEQDEIDLDQEAIERILQMLENQEEESLKNNQEIVSGGDEKNGW